MTDDIEDQTADAALRSTTITTIEGTGQPTVAELRHALGRLDAKATIVDLSTLGGKTQPRWRVRTQVES